MRTLPLSFLAETLAPASGEQHILCLTITHADLVAPMRLASGWTERITTDPLVYGLVSNGNTFLYRPFAWTLPRDGEDALPEITLRVDDYNPTLIALLRSTSVPAKVASFVISSAAPDDVAFELPEFDLVAIDYDASGMTLTLRVESLVTTPVPNGSFTPSSFPGLFG